jgi:DNA-binding NtrC family response regulator
MQYPWPGNVRELENIIERAVIMEKGNSIRQIDLTQTILPGPDASAPVPLSMEAPGAFRAMKDAVIGRFEREYLSRVLRMFEGSLSKASQHAGMNIKNFHEKMARYGLKKEEFKVQKAGGRGRGKKEGQSEK